MLREELLGQIEKAGGILRMNDITFRPHKDGDSNSAICAQDDKSDTKAFLWNHCLNTENFSSTINLGDAKAIIDFFIRLALLEDEKIVLNNDVKIEPEIVGVEESSIKTLSHSQGMVEAYEKILIGREINVKP